jgi:type I restriction enzyme S subunit
MEKQMNIPQLRFPEFQEKWNEEKMGELYSFKVTNSFSRDNLNYEEGTVKNIHYGDIHTKFQTLFDITKETVPFINSDISIDRISEDNYCQEGDLILADASEDLNDVGKSIEIFNLNNEKLLAGLHTILARPNLEKFDIGFGGYLFKSNKVRTKIQKEAQGSKVLSISATRLTNISLDFPSKVEQKKIVECFSAIDKKIQSLKKKHNLLEKYKKGVMQKIFSQELRFKDENGNEFPEWEEKKFGDTLEIVIDNRGKTPPVEKKGIPLLEVNSIGSKEINYNAVSKFVNQDTFDNWFRKYLKSGDVLFSTVGNTALCSYYDGKNKAVIAQNIVGFRFTNELGLFMYYLLTEENNYNKMKAIEMGAVQPSIKVSQLTELFFKIPTKSEQIKVSEFLFSLDKKIEVIKEEIDNVEIWKKGLLQKMFC